jgi:RNA-binding protein 39
MGALDISVEELLESAQRDASAQEAQSTTANKDDDGARSRRGTTADVDMKDSDNVSANGSTRSRRKDRSGDRSSRRPDSRERRERYRSSGGGDFYRGNGRDRDRGDRHSPRRDRGGDSYRGGRAARDRSPPRQRTPEPTDDERDRRTVFVQQLAARLRTKELEAFFTQIGPVKEAQIVKDRVSGRSKGVGYVEFKEEESVQKALGLTGQKLLGIPVIVQLTEAEKNRQARVATGQPTQSNGIPFHRLYVGNIHFSVTEEDLRDVFSPFGELEFVQLQKEENGRSKGYGFVQ